MVFLASAMFLCRRLAALDGRPSPAREFAFRDSIDNADQTHLFGLVI
jgi:hypothetical protein